MALTGRAAVAAVLGALVVLAVRTITMLLAVNAVILVAIVADLVLAAGVRPLRLVRGGDTRIRLGDSGTVTLEVHNLGPRRLRGAVRDAWPPSAGATPGRAQVSVAPGGSLTLTTTLLPTRRTDHGTWRPERDRRILVVLDTSRTAAGRVGGIPRLDTSMDAALLLAALASRAGDRVDLLAVDRRIRAAVVGASRSAVLSAFTSALATLDAELIEADAGLMASAVLSVARQRSLVVLLTDLNAAGVEDGLLPRIPLLAARHQLLVAAVADPRLDEMAAARGTAAAVYEAAAAERARSERARTSALLRRHGARVVDAPPDRLPAALADAYLSLKAGGRL
jgi:uncharacterized protein (DUF58 family)